MFFVSRFVLSHKSCTFFQFCVQQNFRRMLIWPQIYARLRLFYSKTVSFTCLVSVWNKWINNKINLQLTKILKILNIETASSGARKKNLHFFTITPDLISPIVVTHERLLLTGVLGKLEMFLLSLSEERVLRRRSYLTISLLYQVFLYSTRRSWLVHYFLLIEVTFIGAQRTVN